jgi:two-component system OmpR family sensor kinase
VSQPSITRHLVLVLTIGATTLWLLGGLVTMLVVRSELERTLDGGLRETAERVLPLAIDGLTDDTDGDHDPGGRHPGLPESGRGEYVVYQVRDANGLRMRSHDAPEEPFAAPLVEGFVTASPWRIYTTGDPRSGLYIQVAESVERRNAALWGSAAALLLPLLLLIPASILGIRWAVERGMRPLRRLGNEVARRDVANLEPVGDATAPQELRPISSAIDGLLLRLRAAFDAERALAANSAHELRTPIAGSLAQAQRLVDELAGHAAQGRARRVEESLHRLSTLADKLLALSRAEAGVARLAEPIDLLPALRLIAADAQRAFGPRLTLVVAPGTRLVAQLDLDAFGIVMRNLLENAQLHGPSGGPVEIAVGAGFVEVSNAGPVVPGDRLAVLARRFERGSAEAPGSGLGLAIVESITRQVGGRLELLSPRPGHADGFTARIVLGI